MTQKPFIDNIEQCCSRGQRCDLYTGAVLGNLWGYFNSCGCKPGQVKGNVSGNLWGQVLGNTVSNLHECCSRGERCDRYSGVRVDGNAWGYLHSCGCVTGNLWGQLFGDAMGNVSGNLIGQVDGNTTGNLPGCVCQPICESFLIPNCDSCGGLKHKLGEEWTCGNMCGTLVGDVTGNLYGNIIGSICGCGNPRCGNMCWSVQSPTNNVIDRNTVSGYCQYPCDAGPSIAKKEKIKSMLKDKQGKSIQNVPLTRQDIHVEIIDMIAQFTIKQEYTNNLIDPTEISFVFPTPADASIHEFECQIGEETIKAVVKEKEVAVKEYNTAIHAGNTAIMVKKVDGDIFHMALGNIAPKESLTITLKYIVTLNTDLDYNNVRLNVPLTIRPRHSCGSLPRPESYAESINSTTYTYGSQFMTEKPPYTVNLSGNITMTQGISSIKCLQGDNFVYYPAENKFVMNNIQDLGQDIVIIIERKSPISCAIQESWPLKEVPYEYATMLRLTPEKIYADEIATCKNIILCIDISGSMSWNGSIKQAKIACQHFLETLLERYGENSGITVDVYAYESSIHRIPDGRRTLSRENIDDAITFVNSLNAGGGNNEYLALTEIYSRMDDESCCLFLSDGGIESTDMVLQLVTDNAHKLHIFTIGIGTTIGHQIICKMAESTSGKFELASNVNDNIKEKAIKQLDRMIQCFTKPQLILGKNLLIDTADPENMITTDIPKILFEQDENITYIFSKTPITGITVINEDDIHEMIPIQDTTSKIVFRAAAIKFISEYNSCNRNSHIFGKVTQDQRKERILPISVAYNIVSEFTAFIGVLNRKSKIRGSAVLQNVPLQVANQFRHAEGYTSYPESSFASGYASYGVVTGVTGKVFGDVMGNVTGNVCGRLIGNVVGNVWGNVLGNVTGNLCGRITGDITGNLCGRIEGNVPDREQNVIEGIVHEMRYETLLPEYYTIYGGKYIYGRAPGKLDLIRDSIYFFPELNGYYKVIFPGSKSRPFVIGLKDKHLDLFAKEVHLIPTIRYRDLISKIIRKTKKYIAVATLPLDGIIKKRKYNLLCIDEPENYQIVDVTYNKTKNVYILTNVSP